MPISARRGCAILGAREPVHTGGAATAEPTSWTRTTRGLKAMSMMRRRRYGVLTAAGSTPSGPKTTGLAQFVRRRIDPLGCRAQAATQSDLAT